MHVFMILDPDTCMNDAYAPRSLFLMHMCKMYISMILALDPQACMYACMYDPYIYDEVFFGNERTDQRTDEKADLAVG